MLKFMSFPLTQGSSIFKNLSLKFGKFGPSNVKLVFHRLLYTSKPLSETSLHAEAKLVARSRNISIYWLNKN